MRGFWGVLERLPLLLVMFTGFFSIGGRASAAKSSVLPMLAPLAVQSHPNGSPNQNMEPPISTLNPAKPLPPILPSSKITHAHTSTGNPDTVSGFYGFADGVAELLRLGSL